MQKKKKIPYSSFAASVHTIHINSSQRFKHEWSNARHVYAKRELLVILILLTLPPAAMSTSHHFNVAKYPTTAIQQSAYTPTSEPTIFTDFKTWVVALASLIVVMGIGVRSCYCNVVCCSTLEDIVGAQADPTPLVTNLASSTTAKMAAPPVTTLGTDSYTMFVNLTLVHR